MGCTKTKLFSSLVINIEKSNFLAVYTTKLIYAFNSSGVNL